MKYQSTRRSCPTASLSQAIIDGLAPDGGLYVPAEMPMHDPVVFAGLTRIPDIAHRLLAPFFAGDRLAPMLEEICHDALDFPIPLRHLPDGRTAVLELFHGPTAAFKDVGARFLAACLSRIPEGQGQTILVATSGDTGAAIASAFHARPEIQVVILFPEGGVSQRQQHQLTCWGDNVRSLAVCGTFDDCQRMVKAAFGEPELKRRRRLTSANSISIGRLLPQTVYHAAATLWFSERKGSRPGLIVPTGNLGNALAALWAMRIGFPVGHVGLATNANKVVPEFLESGDYSPHPSVRTLANAMDVGDPSNMERVLHLYGTAPALRRDASALSVSDQTIEREIAAGPERWQSVWCPHTATAIHMRQQQQTPDWIVVATAHPAKFETIVEPLIGAPVPAPASLLALLERPSSFDRIDPTLDALRDCLATG